MDLEVRTRPCVPVPVGHGTCQGFRASYLRRELDDFRMRLWLADLSITPAPPILVNRNSAILADRPSTSFANPPTTSFVDRYSTKITVSMPPTYLVRARTLSPS